MGMTAAQKISAVFEGNEPALIAEWPLVKDIAGFGLRVLDYDTAMRERAENVIALITDMAAHLARKALLDEAFRGSRVLWLPMAAFDPSPQACVYTLRLLLRSDFEAAVRRCREIADRVASAASPMLIRSRDCELKCVFAAPAKAFPHAPRSFLRPGEWREAPEFFEVGLAAAFELAGSFAASGILAAIDERAPDRVVMRHRVASKVVRPFGESGPHRLRVADSWPVGLQEQDEAQVLTVIDGRSHYVPTIDRCCRRAAVDRFVEFAIGTNDIAPAVDWSVNSCLNEGVLGVHIGMGDAIKSCHVDFISPGASVDFGDGQVLYG
jgi:hypothetical protein